MAARLELDDAFRRTCARLRTPVWVYDPATRRMLWGNRAAVWLWRRASLEDFVSVEVEMTEANRIRGRSIVERVASGADECVSEQWTFFPTGAPVTATCDMTAIYQPGLAHAALMVHAQTMMPADDGAPSATSEALRNVEMMRHLPISVAMYAPATGAVLTQNPMSLRLFGRDHRLFDLFADPADAGAARRAVADRGAFRGEVRVRSQHDHDAAGAALHALEINVTKDPLTGEPILLAYQVPMENFAFVRTLRRAQEAAVAASEAKTRFLSMVSHEIRTPLHGILGFAELLDATPLSEEQSSYVDMLRMSGRALLSIINDILQLSRIEAGRLELLWTPLCLRETLDETVNIAFGAASEKRISVAWSVDAGVGNDFYGDPKHLKQILINLVGNGVKFTPPRGIVAVDVFKLDAAARVDGSDEARSANGHVDDEASATTPGTAEGSAGTAAGSTAGAAAPSAQTRLSGRTQLTPAVLADMLACADTLRSTCLARAQLIMSHDDAEGEPHDATFEVALLVFAVVDTGIGIPVQTTLDHLCKPFTQLDSSNTRSYEGTGLGLAITKQLAEAMGGMLFLSSQLGVGSTFYCLIPFVVAQRTGSSLLINSRTRNSSNASSQLRDEHVGGQRDERLGGGLRELSLRNEREGGSREWTLRGGGQRVGSKTSLSEEREGGLHAGSPRVGSKTSLSDESEGGLRAGSSRVGSKTSLSEEREGGLRVGSKSSSGDSADPYTSSSFMRMLSPDLDLDLQHLRRVSFKGDNLAATATWATHAASATAGAEAGSGVTNAGATEGISASSAAPPISTPSMLPSVRFVPATPKPPHTSADDTTAVAAPPHADMACRVLVVEDNPVNQRLMGRIMSLLNCEYVAAFNGQEAVDAVTLHGPAAFDVVLMDISMPVMDGLEATRTLVARHPDPLARPFIVAMTANAMDDNRATCLEAGMDDFLSKPCTVIDIRKVVERVRGRRHSVSARLAALNG